MHALQRQAGSDDALPLRGVATASIDVAEQAEDDRLLLEKMQKRVAALVGVPMHADELNPFLKFDQPGEGSATAGGDDLSIGHPNLANFNSSSHNPRIKKAGASFHWLSGW